MGFRKANERTLDSRDIAASGARRRPGRPPVHDEAWTKVTVVLFDRQIDYLDRLARDIRAKHGAAVSRAQLIRALVDAIAESNLDLTPACTEGDLKKALVALLGR